jgi:lipopolysaccharide export system protein LptA
LGRPGAFLAVLLIALANATPALAERADRDKPINMEADTLTLDDAKKTAVYQGHVSFTQGTLWLRADRVEMRQDAQGFDSATATGAPVSFRQKADNSDDFIEGWAGRVQYDGRAGTLELFGAARVRRGSDELKGEYIAYDSRTEAYRVTGGGKDGGPGRVRAVIRPKPKAGAEAGKTAP